MNPSRSNDLANQELRTDIHFNQAILDALPSQIAVVDQNHELIPVNPPVPKLSPQTVGKETQRPGDVEIAVPANTQDIRQPELKPTEPFDVVQEASEESFPASDSPAY